MLQRPPAKRLIVLAGQSNAGWPLQAFDHQPWPAPPGHCFSQLQSTASGAVSALHWTSQAKGSVSALSYYLSQALVALTPTAAQLPARNGLTGWRETAFLDLSYPGSSLDAWLPAQQTSAAGEPPHFSKAWQAGALWQQRLQAALALQPDALIWYQGEQDAMNKTLQADQWRQQLRRWLSVVRCDYQGPLLAIQLAGFGTNRPQPDARFAAIRQQQAEIFYSAPGCQLVTAADLGHASDIHLGDKAQLARRLAHALTQAATPAKTTSAVATMDWPALQLQLPAGHWQQGQLVSSAEWVDSTGPTPLLGWLADGRTVPLVATAITAADSICATPPATDLSNTQPPGKRLPSQRLQITLPPQIAASALQAVAYGWANRPALCWYQQADRATPHKTQQPLYLPLLPWRWIRPACPK